MDTEDYVALLAADLAGEGGTVEMGPATLTLTRYMGRALDHPTVIRATADAFHAYLDSKARSGLAVWPEAGPRRAAYQLFLVHLDEEMTVCAGNPDTITITARGMKTRRSQPHEAPSYPPGDYEWRAGDGGSRSA